MPVQHKVRFDGVMPRAPWRSPPRCRIPTRRSSASSTCWRPSAVAAPTSPCCSNIHRRWNGLPSFSAPRAGATYLARHPILLDEFLDARQLVRSPTFPSSAVELETELDRLEPDMERQMDVMRERLHAQVFAMLTKDIAGKLTVETLADHLSALADLILELTIPTCWRKLRKRHCERPRSA